MVRLLFLLIGLSLGACQTIDEDSRAEQHPNILWLVAEDLSPVIPSFGDSTIVTPHLSLLAREGVCYDNVFSPSGVCAPSRAAIATGMYPTRIGANHMRTGPWFPGISQQFIDNYARTSMPAGLEPYEAIPPTGVKMFSEYLRASGYYCTNNAKEDYQFRKTLMAWDESSKEAHWRNRAPGQPFFSVINMEVTHESRIWAKASDSLWVDNNLTVPVPPYLPQTDSALMDVRRMYSNILEMDAQVGQILKELEEDGLLEETIIFWYTDHGGPLPRQKRLTYDSGLRVPMIIRFPGKRSAGSRDKQLISFVDLAPTVLSLANIAPPEYMDGQAFLGPYKSVNKRTYIHAAADRFDESPADPIRTVRDSQYKYIRYFKPELPMFYHVNYRDQMPIMRSLYRLRDAGELSAEQALWFRAVKPEEELFDTFTDPHELVNLANNQAYDKIKERLKSELDNWLSEAQDLNLMPEYELIEYFWPEGTKPVTATPTINRSTENRLTISCTTEGATIGYRRFIGTDTTDTWTIYKEPLQLEEDEHITVVADRIGFYPSPQVTQ